MATGRLTFLYPHLCRTGRWSEPAVAHLVTPKSPRRRPSTTATSPSLACQHSHPFTSQAPRSQAVLSKRHGKAVEPIALPALEQSIPVEPKSDAKEGGVEGKDEGSPQGQERAARPAAKPSQQPEQPPQQNQASPSPPAATPLTPDKSSASAQAVPDPSPADPPPPPPPSSNPGDPPDDPGNKTKGTSGPMDTILHMGPPPEPAPSSLHFPSDSTRDPSSYKWAPHLHPPPYVHHFDSYSLVKQLSAGGYTLGQAITAMKAVRNLLATNLDVAQSGLVSKADVENESYLFRAACSELSTEVRNNRRVADEQLRQQRTLLQYEVDILTQQLSQDSLTLNDAVRGMFNDRRMVVREEQKALENRVQQINYKITVSLNSDAKSDIENLRWVLIRRATIGIVFMLIVSFGTLRYASHVGQARKEAADHLRQEREREADDARRNAGKIDAATAPAAAAILAAG
ncbi:hypothetical protein B0T18DRAFT_433257 [Schizothecium vesticola]|uniref:DUF1640-domain-containing protein n=1 Tax=Schizothecium vesticola TaxID=314040 RepID=A0AA40EEF8_9PEZI|nr:hypothetical protein B0T18DRAFT_433257 [Schizothecium vesticola]